jgi:hypothetical protein
MYPAFGSALGEIGPPSAGPLIGTDGVNQMGSGLQVILRKAAEERPFLVLGFLAGFAVSAAIGAVLYFYLAVG